jgi:hypothetical protein
MKKVLSILVLALVAVQFPFALMSSTDFLFNPMVLTSNYFSI